MRLKAARTQLGFSREALAFHSGVSWSAIAQVENGRRRNVRPATLAALAHALNVSIDYLVTGHPASPPMLQHSAIVYRSDDEFLESVLPFVEEAEERSEPTLVVSTEANIESLRSALAPPDGVVKLVERSRWATNPPAAVEELGAFLELSLGAGAPRARVIAEPAWEHSADPEVHVWGRYEALVNFAFSACSVRVLCPYDARTVPAEVCQQAEAVHPHGPLGSPEAPRNRQESS